MGRHRRADGSRAAGEKGERPGATLFKQLLSLPVAGSAVYLASAVVRRGRAPGGPAIVGAAMLFLVGFPFAWLWASDAWRRLRDWRLMVAAPLLASSTTLAVVGAPDRGACVPLRTYRIGVTPADVAVAEGAAWVTDWQQSPGRLYRVSLDGTSSVEAVALAGAFEVAGDSQRLYVTSDRAPELSEVDPRTARVVGTVALPGAAADIAATASDVWMTFPDQRLVGRLDRASERLDVFPLDAEPLSVAADGERAWVTGSDGALHELDRVTGRAGRVVSVGRRSYGVFAADGAVWVAVTGEDAVVRYDVVTGGTRRFRVPGAPSDLVVQAGRLWVVSQDGGTLTVLDARTAEFVQSFDVGGAPLKLEPSGPDVFVTNPGTAEVHRVDSRCTVASAS